MVDWDYSSEYCDGCAELGMTTCSCEPDDVCSNCGEPVYYGEDMCEECQEEEDNLFLDEEEE